MKTPACLAVLLSVLGFAPAGWSRPPSQAEDVLESSDLFWVPTIDQAVQMARATGKPIFSMGYSLVPDGTTYTQKGDACPKSVF